MTKNRNAPKDSGGTDRIGETPVSWRFPVALALDVFLLQFIATEFLAWQLHYNRSLGRSFFHVYAPWSWGIWAWKFYDVLGHFHGPMHVYPPFIYAAFMHLPYALAPAFIVCLVTSALLITPPTKVNPDDLYGSGAVWADEKTAKEDGLLSAQAGPIIGGFEKSNGKIVPLRYDGALGISYVESPGGGKSSWLNSNMLIPLQHALASKMSVKERRQHTWGEEPSIIASDPKGELFRLTSGYQKDVLGKAIYLLAPFGVPEDLVGKISNDDLACFNPLWDARIGTDLGFIDCLTKALNIVDADGKGLPTHWDRTSVSWGGALFEKLAFRAINLGDYEKFSLPGLVDFLQAFESMDALLKHMLEVPDDPVGVFGWKRETPDGRYEPTLVKPSIFGASMEMAAKDPKERAGVFSTLSGFLTLYRGENIRRYLTKSTFDFSAIVNDEKRAGTVYIAMNPSDIPKLRPYIRQVFGSAIDQLLSGGVVELDGRSVRGNFRSTFLLMDEIAAWKKLENIESGSGYFRAYGIVLGLIWQSVAQQTLNYGKEFVMNETMDVLLYGRPRMADGAKLIAEQLGDRYKLVKKRNLSGERFAMMSKQAQDSQDAVKLPLMDEKAIRQMDPERYICFYRGHNYFLRKWEYYKNATMNKRAKIPPASKSDVTVSVPLFVRSAILQLSPEAVERWREYVVKGGHTAKPGSAPGGKGTHETREVPTEVSRSAAAKAAVAEAKPREPAPLSIVVKAQGPLQAYFKALDATKQRRIAAQQVVESELAHAR